MKKTASISTIKKDAAKHDGSEGKVWWYMICRNIGIYIGKLLLYTPVTANFITVLTMLSSITAGVFISFNYFLIGFIFMLVGHLLDYVDGIIARAKKQVSEILSFYLDGMYHELGPSFIILGLGFAFYFNTTNRSYLLLGVLGCISYLITSYLLNLKKVTFLQADIEMNKKPNEINYIHIPFGDEKLSKIKKLLYEISILPMKSFMIAYLFFYLIGYLNIMLIFYSSFIIVRLIALYILLYISVKKKEVELRKFRRANKLQSSK